MSPACDCSSRILAISPIKVFSGGMLTQETKAEFGDKLYRLFPTLRLFGFSMGATMYASRIGVDFAVPLTAETAQYARTVYPKLACPETALEASDITAVMRAVTDVTPCSHESLLRDSPDDQRLHQR